MQFENIIKMFSASDENLSKIVQLSRHYTEIQSSIEKQKTEYHDISRLRLHLAHSSLPLDVIDENDLNVINKTFSNVFSKHPHAVHMVVTNKLDMKSGVFSTKPFNNIVKTLESTFKFDEDGYVLISQVKDTSENYVKGIIHCFIVFDKSEVDFEKTKRYGVLTSELKNTRNELLCLLEDFIEV